MLMGLLLPVLLVSSLGHLSPRRIGLWMAGAALVLTALALHDVSRGAEHFIWGNYKPGAPLRVISAQLFGFCVVGFYIAHALVLASAQDGAAWPAIRPILKLPGSSASSCCFPCCSWPCWYWCCGWAGSCFC